MSLNVENRHSTSLTVFPLITSFPPVRRQNLKHRRRKAKTNAGTSTRFRLHNAQNATGCCRSVQVYGGSSSRFLQLFPQPGQMNCELHIRQHENGITKEKWKCWDLPFSVETVCTCMLVIRQLTCRMRQWKPSEAISCLDRFAKFVQSVNKFRSTMENGFFSDKPDSWRVNCGKSRHLYLKLTSTAYFASLGM